MLIDVRDFNQLSFAWDSRQYFDVDNNGLIVKRGKLGLDNVLYNLSVTPTPPATFNGTTEATDWNGSTVGSVAVALDTDAQEIIIDIGGTRVLQKVLLDFLLQTGDTLGPVECWLSQDGINYDYPLHELASNGSVVPPVGDSLILYTQRPEGFPTQKIKIIASGSTKYPLKTVIREIQGYEAEVYPFAYRRTDGTKALMTFDIVTPFRGNDVDTFAVVASTPLLGGEVKYRWKLDNWYYYHDGANWVQINNYQEGWLEQANTEAELQALIIANGSLQLPTGSSEKNIVLSVLYSTVAQESPGLTSVEVGVV